MKTTILFTALLSMFYFPQLFGATDSLYTTTVDAEVSVVDLIEAEEKVRAFIEDREIIPDKFWKSKTNLTVKMTLNRIDYVAFAVTIDEWGYSVKNQVSSTNYANRLETNQKEIKDLKREIAQYNEVLERLSDTSEKYFKYWEKVMSLERTLDQLATNRTYLKNVKQEFSVTIILKEAPNTTNQETEIWVNMPGVEYTMLFTEIPVAGLTPTRMTGYSLKYMFTKGKTYGLLGIYKSNEVNPEGTAIDDIYMLGIGQDLYSKHLGRGKNKFFNLYTSFNAGGYLATGRERKVVSGYISPYFGVEIFKNKNILIDNKVGYFLPFSENRTTRGLLYSVSLNFVF